MIKKLTKNYELMLNKRNSIEIYFPEFNLNYPEVYEIPEIRNWFKKSVIKGIPWFYFLNVEEPSISLNLLLYCTCDVKVLNIKDQNHILEIIYKEQIIHWIETNFHNLNLFIDSNNIPEEINQEISESIGDWISKNLIGF